MGRGTQNLPVSAWRLAIERVNQVWCADVTSIPMAEGFLYLVVIMDWASRAVLAWRLSNTLGADFCAEAIEDALSRHRRPQIFNTDRELAPAKAGGRCMDSIFIERLWRSRGGLPARRRDGRRGQGRHRRPASIGADIESGKATP